jgi:hypothetical protein
MPENLCYELNGILLRNIIIFNYHTYAMAFDMMVFNSFNMTK